MAYPIAAGSTSYSGTFIPEIWSKKLIEKFYASTVLTAISNTNYEGEIRSQGDKVKIRTIPTLNINDYKSGDNLINQRPTSSNVELLIDKGKYWSAIVDDVQDVQSDIGLMNMWAQDAAEQMKIAIDTDVLGLLVRSLAILLLVLRLVLSKLARTPSLLTSCGWHSALTSRIALRRAASSFCRTGRLRCSSCPTSRMRL